MFAGSAAQRADRALLAEALIAGGLYQNFAGRRRPASCIAEALLGRTVTVGPEVVQPLSGSYADLYRRFSVGPELLLLSTVMWRQRVLRDFTNLETR